ncbi:MAG: glycoside hydrolase family 9 protein [Ruminococcus sp.]|nr:glycoside hydrolase family 9 protein [Ruminococcus sp.]
MKAFTKKLAAAAASAAIALTSLPFAAVTAPTAKAADLDLDNYARLLQYSLYFYDANYCGEGAGEKSHFSWRDDCHKSDVVPYGFHDAGDAIICGLTEGFTASTLGWMYYEYKEDFDKTGTTAHMKDITDWFAKFMKASTTLDGSGNVTNFIYEIGDDGKDHGKWRAPELMDSRGSDENYSTTNGASDVAAQYAAALAQNYINFGDEDDLKYAKSLYDFAAKNRRMTTEQMTYSDKSVEDDIAWAAGWLYLATNEPTYLEANSKDTSGTNDWVNDYYYGGVWLGAALINAEITGNWEAPVNYIKSVTDANQNQFYIMNSWGSARHNTLMQMCAMVATKYKDKSGADFGEWCKKQMNMILGDNNANVCLVVGYNDVSATSPHHRAASGLYVDDGWNQWNSWDGNYASVPTSHVLYGALCGGPTGQDFSTFRKYDAKDATSNEVALDYQVGLVGAAAGLYHEFQTGKVVAEIGDEVTVYAEEKAAANGQLPGTSTTTTTTTTSTTTTTTTTTTTSTTTTTPYVLICQKTDIEVGETVRVNIGKWDREVRAWNATVEGDAVEITNYNVPYFDVTGKKAGEATVNVTFMFGGYKTITFTVKDNSSPSLLGDANCDEQVNMADAVFIMQTIGNPDKYQLTDKGEKNADVDGSGDITNMDALMIQKLKLGIITKFPAES